MRAPPPRVYGRVDQLEPPDEETAAELASRRERGGQRTVLIDCVDATWFDEVGQYAGWLGAATILEESERNLSVVEGRADLFFGLGDDLKAEGEWLELELTDGADVSQYLNLFTVPLERGLAGWSPIQDSRRRSRLEHATGLGDLPDAPEEELRGALATASADDAVTVYDVGHGNCNALIDNGSPTLYFDFGGGVLRNSGTFPSALKDFCMGNDLPIVLSIGTSTTGRPASGIRERSAGPGSCPARGSDRRTRRSSGRSAPAAECSFGRPGSAHCAEAPC
jgi:hypothetical protein